MCVCVAHTYTTFSLTQFGSVISLGTVTKRSMNEAEPCRIDPHWDLLTEPGQASTVRFGRSASVNTSITGRANCFQSDERATDCVCVCVTQLQEVIHEASGGVRIYKGEAH